MLDDFLEVARRRLEGLLEALPDLAVGLPDQPLQLREGGLEVLALRFELLDVGNGLLVLLGGERIDRTELLAPALEALDARAQGLALLLRQRLLGGLRLEAQPLRQLPQLALGLGGRVAHLLRRHLGGRDRLAGLAQATLELRLLVGAGAQLRAGRSPAAAPASSSASTAARRASTASRAVSSAAAARWAASWRASSLAIPAWRALTVRSRFPRSRSARSARRRSARRSAWTSARRTASGPSSGLAAPLDQPCHPTGLLGGLIVPALGAPERALGLVAPRRPARRRPPRLGHPRLGLLGGRPLGVRGELVAPTALREQLLGAAGRRLAELAARDVEHAAALGDGDAVEVLGDRVQGVDDPHVRQQAFRQPGELDPA